MKQEQIINNIQNFDKLNIVNTILETKWGTEKDCEKVYITLSSWKSCLAYPTYP